MRQLPSQLTSLNLFYHRHRSSEATLKQELQSTRLYLILFIASMSTLTFYYSLSYLLITITINNPTPQLYEQLRQSKGVYDLQCPCTHVSVTHEKFIQANTTLHDVCSSSFITDAWIQNIFGNGSWSHSDPTDLRGRGVIYFQSIRSLCYLFQENITQYVSHFLASSFISAQVLSETQLITQVNDSLEQVKASSRADNGAMYGFGRELGNDIQMVTIYSTNWVFAPVKYDPNLVGLPIPLVPVSHGNCSCAVSSKCLEPITLDGQVVPGLMLACLPLESVFKSSIACLYNQTCIDHINLNKLNVTPLVPPTNREWSIDRTVEKIVDNALDLQWSVDINYARFFHECHPVICSYSINERRDTIQVVVTLLGFYGGLTVALRYTVPYVIGFARRIVRKFKQTTNDVQPEVPVKF